MKTRGKFHPRDFTCFWDDHEWEKTGQLARGPRLTFARCCLTEVGRQKCFEGALMGWYNFERCCVLRRYDGQDVLLPLHLGSTINIELFGHRVELHQGGGLHFTSNLPSLKELSSHAALLWHGSYALARWLEDSVDLPCSFWQGGDKLAVELGSGVGLGAIAVRALGIARVLATDLDPFAVATGQHNALAALGVERAATMNFTQLDWSAETEDGPVWSRLRTLLVGPASVGVGGADVILLPAVCRWLGHAAWKVVAQLLNPNGIVLLSERRTLYGVNVSANSRLQHYFFVEAEVNPHHRGYLARDLGYHGDDWMLQLLRPKHRASRPSGM
eukprot:gnl/TRDRNA2_/TRDRNA2_150842_c2_seq1.p1 gnl/TRDRNA2_/TRDRNA2_150842_c2~~gnl/TRDRNA2_/TRDRNA2_150842_c2_seq1.p1  ORF type:complete len:330 (-),score=37.87 gnl/TRDRNA2_/TRDRNA2_150842_c2_seq1:71-1060(-)